jgi:hypothetical protein
MRNLVKLVKFEESLECVFMESACCQRYVFKLP